MNILFIGPYYQSDHWGETSRNYIKALNTLEHQLAIRPIYLSQHTPIELEKSLHKLEISASEIENYDIIIQHTLPPFFGHNTKIEKNILLCPLDMNIQDDEIHPWTNHLVNINYIFAPTQEDSLNYINLLGSSYQRNKVQQIGYPINPSYLDCQEKLDLDSESDLLFYIIGDNSDYSNLEILIRAFHGEFDANEPVNLLICTSNIQQTSDKIAQVKQKLHKYANLEDYKREILVPQTNDPNLFMKVHNTGHVFVNITRGNPENTMATIAYDIFDKPGVQPDNHIEPLYTSETPVQDLYDCFRKWNSYDCYELQDMMRSSYLSYKQKINYPLESQTVKETEIRTNLADFSYETIGQNIQKALDAINK